VTAVVWTFALLAAAVHILVFVWEAVLFHRPAVHQGIFSTPAAEVPAVRLWAFGVGFYNLFLGCGTLIGVAVWGAGEVAVGVSLVVYTCLFMVLSGVVLFIADRLAFGRPKGKGIGGAAGQGLPPLIALIALVL
jgi:putative membrane protein